VSSPKYNKIWTIINKLKSKKAGVSDNIPSELIKKWRKHFETENQ